MKRAFILVLAMFILTACGAPTPEPSPSAAPAETPVSTPQTTPTPGREPEYIEGSQVIAWPEEESYELRLDDIGMIMTIPAEAAAKTIVTKELDAADHNGTDVTFYFIREGGYYALLFRVHAEPRYNFFNPVNGYQSEHTTKTIFAVSEDLVYLIIPPSNSDIRPDDPEIGLYRENWTALSDAVYDAQIESLSCLPEPDMAAMSAKAGELAAKGDATMTRAEAAQLAFDLLSAENKDEEYPLNYTDVANDSEYAHAIAYLDSYGVLTRYSREGEDLDGDKFRPDEAITRAEFVMLLHRLSFQPLPVWFGDILETLSTEYWGYFYMNYAWKCGWYELDANGDIRAEEPITAAEAAQALSVVAEIGYPTPGVDFDGNMSVG